MLSATSRKGTENATRIGRRGRGPRRSRNCLLSDRCPDAAVPGEASQIAVGVLPARHDHRRRRSRAEARSVRDVGWTWVDGRDPARSSRRKAFADTARAASHESTETDRTIRPGGHQRSDGAVLRSARVSAEFHLPESRDVGLDHAEPGRLPSAVRRLLARSVDGWTRAADQGRRRRQRFTRSDLHGLLGRPLGG